MISQYLELPDLAYISDGKEYSSYELGYHVRYLQDEMYDFSAFDIVMVGVKESRAAGFKNLGADMAPDEIRRHLYRLQMGSSFPNMIDLGNIMDAEVVGESYEYLEHVLSFVYKSNITAIILGGSQDLTYSQYISFENIQKSVSLLIVDERIDLVQNQESVTSDGFLQHILTLPNPELFHLTFLGIQGYFTNYNVLDVFNSMSYDIVRLGNARYNIPNYQHIFRMSDIVSVDISAVKQSDAPARSMQTPNGFLSDEFCQIARYCGMSEKVKSFGLYELNPQLDIRHQSAQLAAQGLWFFLEGYSYRIDEHPMDEAYSDNFSVFVVELPEFSPNPFQFWHSKVTNNWWVEYPVENKSSNRFLPCSRADYESAANGEMSSWVFHLMSKVM